MKQLTRLFFALAFCLILTNANAQNGLEPDFDKYLVAYEMPSEENSYLKPVSEFILACLGHKVEEMTWYKLSFPKSDYRYAVRFERENTSHLVLFDFQSYSDGLEWNCWAVESIRPKASVGTVWNWLSNPDLEKSLHKKGGKHEVSNEFALIESEFEIPQSSKLTAPDNIRQTTKYGLLKQEKPKILLQFKAGK